MSGRNNIDPEAGRPYMWKPGQSGNPKGVPKVIPNLDVYIIEILTEEGTSGRDGLRVILEALRKKAAAGDVRAIELLLDRAYGKVKQHIDLDSTNIITGKLSVNVISTGVPLSNSEKEVNDTL